MFGTSRECGLHGRVGICHTDAKERSIRAIRVKIAHNFGILLLPLEGYVVFHDWIACSYPPHAGHIVDQYQKLLVQYVIQE